MADNEYKLVFTMSDGSKIDAGTITAPQGPQGEQGPQGPKGDKGDTIASLYENTSEDYGRGFKLDSSSTLADIVYSMLNDFRNGVVSEAIYSYGGDDTQTALNRLLGNPMNAIVSGYNGIDVHFKLFSSDGTLGIVEVIADTYWASSEYVFKGYIISETKETAYFSGWTQVGKVQANYSVSSGSFQIDNVDSWVVGDTVITVPTNKLWALTVTGVNTDSGALLRGLLLTMSKTNTNYIIKSSENVEYNDYASIEFINYGNLGARFGLSNEITQVYVGARAADGHEHSVVIRYQLIVWN